MKSREQYCFSGLLGACFILLSYLPSAGYGEWVHQEAPIMGTRIYVEIWHENPTLAHTIIGEVLAEMERINQTMSPYLDTSELSKINRLAATQPVTLSPELFALIKRSIQYSELSQGAFDITFASLGHKFDYRKSIRPNSAEQNTATALIDYKGITLNDQQHSIRFKTPGMEIDLGGIAKGHAVDNGIKILQKHHIEHAIVTAGGDSRLLGDRLGRPWMLGVRHPRGEGHVITLPLENVAISTSGDYERYFEEGGVRYHHIIDPKKGASAYGVISVTILADESTDADALSTTVFIQGVEAGLKLVNAMPNVSAIIIDQEGVVHYSNDLIDPSMH